MKRVVGGGEFARELYKASDRRQKQRISQPTQLEQQDQSFQTPYEVKLERIVRQYSAAEMKPMLSRPSTGGASRSRIEVFNCTGLSPMVATQFSKTMGCKTTQIPFKPKMLTTHPHDLTASMPKSIRLLKTRFEEKLRKQEADRADRHRAEELARLRFSQSRLQRRFRLGEGLSVQGVEHSPCFEEVIKLRNELRDKPQVSFWSSWEDR